MLYDCVQLTIDIDISDNISIEKYGCGDCGGFDWVEREEEGERERKRGRGRSC